MRTRRLASRYVAQKRAAGRMTKATARSVEYTLLKMADDLGRGVDQIRRKDLQRWIDEPNLAPNTRRQRLSRVRAFWRWLIVEEHTRRDPTADLEAPPAPRGLPRFLTEAEVTRLLDSVPDTRALLVCLLMVQEGLRCVEVARLETGDVDLDRAAVFVRGKGGAGERTRTLPLSTETAAVMRDYLAEHPCGHGPLIRNYRNGASIQPQTLSKYVTEWMREAGLKRHRYDGKSGHALRHSCAQHLADGGADVLRIQAVLGHAELTTTQRYLRGQVGDLRQVMGGRSYLGS